jgi:hypothetical protein
MRCRPRWGRMHRETLPGRLAILHSRDLRGGHPSGRQGGRPHLKATRSLGELRSTWSPPFRRAWCPNRPAPTRPTVVNDRPAYPSALCRNSAGAPSPRPQPEPPPLLLRPVYPRWRPCPSTHRSRSSDHCHAGCASHSRGGAPDEFARWGGRAGTTTSSSRPSCVPKSQQVREDLRAHPNRTMPPRMLESWATSSCLTRGMHPRSERRSRSHLQPRRLTRQRARFRLGMSLRTG